jgi:uncharacterized protein (DUF302 family)
MVLLVFSVVLPLVAVADDGIGSKQSNHSVTVTAERFEEAVRSKGMKVFSRFDHGAAAAEYGQSMLPTIVLSFGNPKYGTKFMIENPVAGIDFPPKVIVYEDKDGQVWIAYNTAEYLYETIFRRHGLEYPEGDVAFFAKALDGLTDHAAGIE